MSEETPNLEEKVQVEKRPALPKKKKIHKPFSSGKRYVGDDDARALSKFTKKLMDRLGLKSGTRSRKV